MTVYGQYILDCILMAKKESIDTKLSKIVHPYNTRKKMDTISQQHNLKFYEKKPSYMGIQFLKYIPKKIKNEKSATKFKRMLKEHLVGLATYSLDDFFHSSLNER